MLAGLAALGTLGYGLFVWAARGELAGAGIVALSVFFLAVAFFLYGQFSLAHKAVSLSYRAYDALLDIAEHLRRQTEHTRTIAENSSLSEWAKRIIYREKDYEYLHDTIQAASVRQDWAAAERLVRELDEEFGLKEEAARLREELENARKATHDEKIAAALQRFNALCEARKWDQAHSEVDRLRLLYPQEPQISALPRELEQRRRHYKRDLLKRYEEAVRLANVDAAHTLLLELDHYLAPNEAAALKESARGVFRAKLQQMGVQFSLAVTEKNFEKAIEIGEGIIREFPNSRYAQEIQSMMPTLRGRVAQEPAHV